MKASLETPAYYDLSAYSIARVSGDDALAFLQGQLSNDITHLRDDSPHQMSAYCNPKGRILALFHVLKFDDDYLLMAPCAVMDKVLPRLTMFVMRSAVKITLAGELELVGVLAPGITGNELTETIVAGTQIAKHTNDPNRYFLLHDGNTAYDLEPGNEWRRMDIEQNLPQVYIESYEGLIPQSVNLDIVGGVNFKKGCYPGQEIIARIKYRGKPKSRMIGVIFPTNAPVEVGAPIYIEERDRSAGEVLNTAHDNEKTVLSISVPLTHISAGALYLNEAKTITLERINSPYKITA